jgi:hypothetical protein
VHHSICLRTDIAGIDDGSFPQVFYKALIQNNNPPLLSSSGSESAMHLQIGAKLRASKQQLA